MFEGKLHYDYGDHSAVTTAELFAWIGERFKAKYSPLAPATINHIAIIGDCSDIGIDPTDTCRLPVRGYLNAKCTSSVSWQAWINAPEPKLKVQGGYFTWTSFVCFTRKHRKSDS